MERGYKAAQERLLKTAVEGHAWQADHVVPVYRGGGRCGLENLRTLCTPCHADVTKQQAKDRAAARCAESAGLAAFTPTSPGRSVMYTWLRTAARVTTRCTHWHQSISIPNVSVIMLQSS